MKEMLASSNNSLPIEWLDEEVLEVKTCPFFLIYIYVYLCVCVCVFQTILIFINLCLENYRSIVNGSNNASLFCRGFLESGLC